MGQEKSGGGAAAAVSIRDGFLQSLPPKALVFFQRVYFADYPRPLQKGGLPPYPFTIEIASFQAPERSAIVFRNSVFKVYRNTGIAPEDQIEVSPSRVTSYFGFQTLLGQSGLTDFASNLNAKGQVLNFGSGKLLGNATAPTPGQGSFFPFPGNAQRGLQNFAYYVMPGQLMKFNAVILRPPPYEASRVSVEVTGYNIGATALDRVLSRLSSGSG